MVEVVLLIILVNSLCCAVNLSYARLFSQLWLKIVAFLKTHVVFVGGVECLLSGRRLLNKHTICQSDICGRRADEANANGAGEESRLHLTHISTASHKNKSTIYGSIEAETNYHWHTCFAVVDFEVIASSRVECPLQCCLKYKKESHN